MTGEDLREEYSVGAEMTGKGVDAIVRLFYERGLYTGEVGEYACGRLLGNTWFMVSGLAVDPAYPLRRLLPGGGVFLLICDDWKILSSLACFGVPCVFDKEVVQAKLLFAPSEATSLRSVLTGGSPDVDFSSTGMVCDGGVYKAK